MTMLLLINYFEFESISLKSTIFSKRLAKHILFHCCIQLHFRWYSPHTPIFDVYLKYSRFLPLLLPGVVRIRTKAQRSFYVYFSSSSILFYIRSFHFNRLCVITLNQIILWPSYFGGIVLSRS
jgi:hypothetical protein